MLNLKILKNISVVVVSTSIIWIVLLLVYLIENLDKFNLGLINIFDIIAIILIPALYLYYILKMNYEDVLKKRKKNVFFILFSKTTFAFAVVLSTHEILVLNEFMYLTYILLLMALYFQNIASEITKTASESVY